MQKKTAKNRVNCEQLLKTAKAFYWVAVIVMLIGMVLSAIALIGGEVALSVVWVLLVTALWVMTATAIPYLVALIGSIVCLCLSGKYPKKVAAEVRIWSGAVVIEAASILLLRGLTGVIGGGSKADYANMLLSAAIAILAIIIPKRLMECSKIDNKSQ